MQSIEKKVQSDMLHFNDIAVLKYTIEYPSFRSTCNQRAVDIINEYYTSLAKRKEQYCRQFLYPQAVEAARYIQENTPPFNYYEFDMTYKITWNKGCITSLYMEEYTYLGGAHGLTIRSSDTWDFSAIRYCALCCRFSGVFNSSEFFHYWHNISLVYIQTVIKYIHTANI